MAGESKTEKASPKKRKDERKKGNVYSSKDIVNLVSILAVFYSLKLLFPMIYERLGGFLFQYADYAAYTQTLTLEMIGQVLLEAIVLFAVTTLPIMAISMASSIIATGAQTRFLFSGESLKPKFSRLSPIQGIKRMFSMRSVIEVLKGVLKIAIIGYILYGFITDQVKTFSTMLNLSIMQSVVIILQAVMDMVFDVSIIFIFLAALDYLYQWWDYERQIKMSKQEVKEEYRQMEGDPQVQGQIKERRRRMAMSRMMQAVPTADVIIRNPTHYAVALRYNIDLDNAPIVVAKGMDEVALRIVKVAEENDVFVMEQKELTRAIFSASEVGQEIPITYYNAVAEVLAVVYSAKQKQI